MHANFTYTFTYTKPLIILTMKKDCNSRVRQTS